MSTLSASMLCVESWSRRGRGIERGTTLATCIRYEEYCHGPTTGQQASRKSIPANTLLPLFLMQAP